MAANEQPGLGEAVAWTLQQEARRNETVIAQVRATVLVLVTLLNTLAWLRPAGFQLPYEFSGLNALVSALWLAAACAVLATLFRGWYRPWLRFAMPFFDGAILLTLFACVVLTTDAAEQRTPALMNIGIACAVLAASGALRLHAGAVWLSTGMAILVFVVVDWLVGRPVPETAFSCALIVGGGALSWWMSGIVRRCVQGEVGRMVLQRFLPAEVVNGAHAHPLQLLGRPRKVVATVMVTDLRGFTRLAEQLAPEEALVRLNHIQSRLASVVQAHGGTVDKFMGDGMLAVFGMAGQDGPHARQATEAARAMREAGAALSRELATEVRIGVGMHTGSLVAGCLGDERRMEFTVIGDTVNMASRLQDITKELQVDAVASAATVRAATKAGGGGFRSLGTVGIRGREAGVEVYALDSGKAGAHQH